VGGRDLSAEVGGIMCRRGIELLAGDPATEVIVVISKPPDPDVAGAIVDVAAAAPQPAVLAFLGPAEAPSGVEYAASVDRAAQRAAELVGRSAPAFAEAPARPPSAGHIRGLYAGGTLCQDAMSVVSAAVSRVASNIPLRPEWVLADVQVSDGHTFIDFGADELTEGRPHPMIDPSLRTERFRREARDPDVAVLLLDVVLGYGAHPDPGAELAPAVGEAVGEREDLNVIVALCGADGDPQDLARQRTVLMQAGAAVTRSNEHAARMALQAIAAGEASRVGP
jgi:FdrA protein